LPLDSGFSSLAFHALSEVLEKQSVTKARGANLNSKGATKMGIIERTYGKDTNAVINEVLISSDSHVIEPEGLWKKQMPKAFQDRAPNFGGQRPNDVPGAAMDKTKRVSEMAADGVSAEVLYPTHGLKCLSLDDNELEAACCRVYNDWLIDYCGASPDRLIGIAMLSMYDIDGAVKELERCRKAGMRGSVIWQVPPSELPFSSSHYDKFWATSQDLDMPVNLHILSGHGYSRSRSFGLGDTPTGLTQEANSVNMKLFQSVNSLYELIYSGVLERFPKLKVVLVENELGWIPFVLEQWDYYFKRHGAKREGLAIKKLPSEYFHNQIYTTFFNDAVGGHILSWWGIDNCMWSNDFPHGNSTWPNSRRVVARDLGDLPAGSRAKLVRENVARLYNIAVPSPIQ
jgi:predicted TIM-barrel fold metal-dependent hydrolase